MKKWYGERVLQDFDARGYVVDHLVNEGTDCRISNLEFLKKSHNTAKGQTFDQESEKLIPSMVVGLFKDFSTGYYQITIDFNEKVCGKEEDGSLLLVDCVRLLYNCDYARVVLDAESIVLQFEIDRKINLEKLSNADRKIDLVQVAIIPEEMKDFANIQINSDYWQVTEDKRTITLSSYFDEGWTPPK